MKRNIQVGRVWNEVEKIIREHKLPSRLETPMLDASFGYKIRNSSYREESEISDVVANRDLKKLCDFAFPLNRRQA